MLLKITNVCHMNCSHCLEDATPNGEHMTMKTFYEVLEYLKKVKPLVILVSGGEPTEHPHFFEIVNELKKHFISEGIMVASNGMFLDNEDFTEKVLSLEVSVQITNDIRYYPKRINIARNHKYLIYENQLRTLYPQGRAKNNGFKAINCTAPKCFNIRSICCNNVENFASGIRLLERNMKFCTPSIGIDGSIYLGESSLCEPIGDIKMSDNEIINRIKCFKCNKCGMEDNLSEFHLKHIHI